MKPSLLRAVVLVAALGIGPATQAADGAMTPAVGGAPVLLQPSGDVAQQNVSAVRNDSTVTKTALWPFVDDGTSFSNADDDASVVRTKSRASSALHETSFSGAPAGVVTDVVVNLRADSVAMGAGTVQVVLYDGSRQVGAGQPHVVSGRWTNYVDDFPALQVQNANNLRTAVRFANTTRQGALQYTELWASLTYQAPSPAIATPTVTILSPADGAVVSGDVTVTGTASNTSALSIAVDGGILGTLIPA